eukprot:15359131-Ditylum_brightwellii.AAC.1
MLSFSSIKFSKLYLDTYLPSSIKIRHLRMTNEYSDLLDHIDRAIQCVNNHRGWNVVGWYKNGVINDCTLVGDNNNTSGNNNINTNEDVLEGETSPLLQLSELQDCEYCLWHNKATLQGYTQTFKANKSFWIKTLNNCHVG